MRPEPSTAAGRAGLAALRATPERALVGLDFDGTLAPIVADPDRARAHPQVPATLHRLAEHVGRVAVVTGRPAALAVEYGSLADVPGLVVLGHYGLERWESGSVAAPGDDAGVEKVRRRLPGLLAELGAPAGVHVEDKQRALAVHLRRTPDPDAAAALLTGPLTDLAREHDLVVEPGRMVVELRPAGADKGGAVRALVDELDPSVVVFVGDDLGDLAAFGAVEAARARGRPGLLVCSGSEEVTELAGRADLVVDGPAGVVALLSALADDLARPRGR